MKRIQHINTISAQVMLEYLIMTMLVAFLVFSALNFKKSDSIGSQTMDQAQDYYKQGYKLIKGGSGGAISGGWCEWSECVDGYKERSCACPRPALGGSNCRGVSYKGC